MNSRLLPSVAILLAIAVFFVYVNRTWAGSIAEINTKIESDQAALDVAANFMKQQSELEAEKQQIKPEDMAKLNLLLPTSVDNVHLILDLNALAAKSGLSLSNIDVTPPSQSNASSNTDSAVSSDSNPVGSVDLSLSAVGTYTAVQTFLTSVEKSQRLLDIQDLTLKGSDTGVYSYDMKIRLYWLH
ncbi:MAG: hypothetical protein JWN18_294 [Parcubacteria group bacterium]|nr:hypothetical protein [Parcubacteria group bacterium]